MWKEILVDDDLKLEEYVNIWNNREGCEVPISSDTLKNIINKKEDAHCYIYDGGAKILLTYKHDVSDNTTYIFHQNSATEIRDINNVDMGNEIWDAYREFMLILLNKYNRPVKMIKWDKRLRIQYIIDMAVSKYAERGIKATNREHNWLFELM